MKFLGYILTYSLVWVLHLLPERMLYALSDFCYFLAYHVIGYRKKVVYNNLEKAFPGHGQGEKRKIARKFYHHLCDTMLESAISHFYSEEKALNRITYTNLEILNELYASQKQVIAVLGHYGNWEYLSTLSLVTEYPFVAVYKPLRNKYYNRMVTKNRTRFGGIVTPMEQIFRKLLELKKQNRPVITLNLSDQSPMFHKIQYWTKFMGIDTPVYLGSEKLAKKMDAAVVFLKIRKISRGRYEVETELICRDPKVMKPHEITEKHVKILEDLIREDPAYWLWSHRRWKHSYEDFMARKVATNQ